MPPMLCPSCNATLPAGEIAAGWCETCGKKIPAFAFHEAAPATSRGKGEGRPALRDRPFRYSEGRALASRLARLGAVLLDLFIALVAYLPGLVLIGLAEPDQPEVVLLGLGLMGVAGLLLTGVQLVLLCLHGQTLGKKMIGVRIVRFEDGRNPGFVSVVLLRSVVPGLIASLPCVGAIFTLVDIAFIFHADHRCVHDLIAGTKVVED